MNRKLLLCLPLLLFSFFCLNAQEKGRPARNSNASCNHLNTTYIKDYQIKVDLKNFTQLPENGMLYLYSNHLGTRKLVDSAKVKGGKAVFKKTQQLEEPNENTLQVGFYNVAPYDKMPPVLLNQSCSLEIFSENGKYRTSKSAVNRILWMLYDGTEFITSSKDAVSVDESNTNFLFKYERFWNELFAFVPDDKTEITEYETILNHFDFSDPRYCNNEYFAKFVDFLKSYLSFEHFTAAELKLRVDYILDCAAKGGDAQLGNFCNVLYNLFLATGDPFYEPLMLHIYDDYDKSWIPERMSRSVKRNMEKARRLSVGTRIPELVAFDKDGVKHSTKDITTKYTILWFWDPDCDHCQEETPILQKYYVDMAETLDFEVFAVEVNEDHDRWISFSETHSLGNWINLSTSMGEPSVDFIEFFDIVTTPVVFLIDNSDGGAILARQISLEEIMDIMKKNNQR